MSVHSYNAEAVEKAIRTSRKPIGRKEARMIHALLKGSTDYAARKAAASDKEA